MFLDHPTITATDSQTEPERIERLNRVYGYAMALAECEACPGLLDKVNQLHDHKGTLIVFWNEPPGEAEQACFARAWASRAGAGSTSVEHEF
jgi:hypothetical protein